MKYLVEALGGWGVPAIIVTAVLVIFLIMQVTGEIIEWTGKVAPRFLKIRKIFKERKMQRIKQRQQLEQLPEMIELMAQVKATLDNVNIHYSEDHITHRNQWMDTVNRNIEWTQERARVYDSSVADLLALRSSVDKLSEFTCKQIKEDYRNRILDFAHRLRNARNKSEPERCSEEEFTKIYDTYENYEAFLEYTHDENHQVDDAMETIRRAERGEIPNIIIE